MGGFPFRRFGRLFEVFHKMQVPTARETVKFHVFGRIALKTGEKVCYTTNI